MSEVTNEHVLIHDFITADERQQLIAFGEEMYPYLTPRKHLSTEESTGQRRADFVHLGDKECSCPECQKGEKPPVEVPIDVIKDIQDRVVEALGLQEFVESPYRPRLVMHDVGADTKRHRDPHGGVRAKHHRQRFGEDGFTCDYHYKVNLLVQPADAGGVFFVEDVPLDMKSGSLAGFWGTRPHNVSIVEAGQRILLTMGWCKNKAA